KEQAQRDSGGISEIFDIKGAVAPGDAAYPRAARRAARAIFRRPRERGRWSPNRLARPMVPRARQPDGSRRSRDLRAPRRSASGALRVADRRSTELCLMPREHLLKIGVSGIRGVVGEFLTPALACQFAEAFGTYVGAGRVVVGRDTRASGPMLEHALICGLLAAGCDVVEVGILPTP